MMSSVPVSHSPDLHTLGGFRTQPMDFSLSSSAHLPGVINSHLYSDDSPIHISSPYLSPLHSRFVLPTAGSMSSLGWISTWCLKPDFDFPTSPPSSSSHVQKAVGWLASRCSSQKSWKLKPCLISHCATRPSANSVSSSFKIYPGSDNSFSLLLLLHWFKPSSFLTWTIVIAFKRSSCFRPCPSDPFKVNARLGHSFP